MKKCDRCDIVFHHGERTRCLYCDGLLMTVSHDDTEVIEGSSPQDMSLIETIVNDRSAVTQDNIRSIVGSYFKSRTFRFFYNFSRSEMRMGQTYKRFLVQPLSPTFFFMIPWVLINFFDSLFFRFIFRSYCPTCQWKFAGSNVRHDPKECAYNREYMLVVNAILTGHIAKLEEAFQFQAMGKIKRGERSAYFDLCSRRDPAEGFWDILCVWFSIGVILYVVVSIAQPYVMKAINAISAHELKELERMGSEE